MKKRIAIYATIMLVSVSMIAGCTKEESTLPEPKKQKEVQLPAPLLSADRGQQDREEDEKVGLAVHEQQPRDSVRSVEQVTYPWRVLHAERRGRIRHGPMDLR